MSNTIVIFIGPPGSGKGSISQLCVKNLGWSQLSTGSLCRKHIAEGTDIGKQIDFAIKSGKLVSDALIVGMVTQWLEENLSLVKGVILDGFPRTAQQAQALNDFIAKKMDLDTVKVFKLMIPDDQVVQRLTARYICENKNCQVVYSLLSGSSMTPKKEMTCDNCQSSLVQRSDDKPDTVRQRLQTYYTHEKSLLDFYEKADKAVQAINVDRPIDQVYKNVITHANIEK